MWPDSGGGRVLVVVVVVIVVVVVVEVVTHWPLRSLSVILLGFAGQRALQYNRDIQYAESKL